MHRPHGREAVVRIVVLVAPIPCTRLDEVAATEVGAMIPRDQQGLKIFGFVRIKRRIEIRPTKELRLVAGKEVRLGGRPSQLHARIDPVEILFAKGHGPLRLRTRPRDVRRQPLPADAHVTQPALIEFLAIQTILPGRKRQ